MVSVVERLWWRLNRRKALTKKEIVETEFSRVLSLCDLISLGVGTTLGAGIYVIAGQVAKYQAGPAVIVCFVIAAVVAMLSGFCYCEFAARVPKTGSAYVYTYLTVGELMAFIVGWNLILENMIGAASVARAFSGYFDSMINHAIQNAIETHIGLMRIEGLNDYIDIFAFAFLVALTLAMCFGVKLSARANNAITLVNVIAIVCAIVAGLVYADLDNWSKPNGFLPFGPSGVITGAATCFYAFVGFDTVATAGEEAKNPKTSIPRAVFASLIVCFFAYFGISCVLTLVVPYNELTDNSALASMFQQAGVPALKYVVAVGALCSLMSSMFGCIFPLPRIIYAMSSDGLLFQFLSRLNQTTNVPVYATVVSGFTAALIALCMDLDALVEMMSIGTLIAYTLVDICVLYLRYQPERIGLGRHDLFPVVGKTEGSSLVDAGEAYTGETGPKYSSTASLIDIAKTPMSLGGATVPEPSRRTGNIVGACIAALFVLLFAVFSLVLFGTRYIAELRWWAITMLVLMSIVIIALVAVISAQPQNVMELSFKTPAVPFLPVVAIAVNICLALSLKNTTWIRFGVWMALGFVIYFSYSLWNSKEATKDNNSSQLKHDDVLTHTTEHRVEESAQ